MSEPSQIINVRFKIRSTRSAGVRLATYWLSAPIKSDDASAFRYPVPSTSCQRHRSNAGSSSTLPSRAATAFIRIGVGNLDPKRHQGPHRGISQAESNGCEQLLTNLYSATHFDHQLVTHSVALETSNATMMRRSVIECLRFVLNRDATKNIKPSDHTTKNNNKTTDRLVSGIPSQTKSTVTVSALQDTEHNRPPKELLPKLK